MRPTLSLTLLSTLVGVSTLAAISACVGSTGPDRTLPFQIAYQWQTADLSAATLLIDQTGADKGVLAKTGDEFWIVTTFEGEARWIRSDRLRSQSCR